MIGTILNVAAVLVGGGLGALFGERLPGRVRGTVIHGLGLFVIALGLKMTLDSQNSLITLGSVLVGGIVGEWWRIEDRLASLGAFLEGRFARSQTSQGSARFIQGFVVSSLVFCVGPMAILGSIQDGLTGNYQILAIKSVLDGFASLAFSATLGVGVLFSSVVILVYQGLLTVLAAQAQSLLSDAMVAEMTAAGGLMVAGIGVGPLLELKKLRVANYLPALFIAPAIVAVLHAVGVAGF